MFRRFLVLCGLVLVLLTQTKMGPKGSDVEEFKSSKLLADIAEQEGFKVERGVADLETS